MIKFFRVIRQSLLSENKFSKYALYAIGEILLVVVGILLALQINNWNEKRKDHQLERQLIDVLISDLKLKKHENLTDLNSGKQILQQSETIMNTWRNRHVLDTMNLKRVLKLLGDDVWFYSENSPVYAGLSNSVLWKQLPDTLTAQLDDIYRRDLMRIKISFSKSAEYATYCKLNFLAKNNLIDLSRSNEALMEILSNHDAEFISYVEIFRGSVARLIRNNDRSIKSIDRVTVGLEVYKKN